MFQSRIRIDQVPNQIRGLERFLGFIDHIGIKAPLFRAVNPGSINKDGLAFFFCENSKNSITSRLSFRSDNGEFGSKNSVEKGRFSSIRAPDQCNKSNFLHTTFYFQFVSFDREWLN